jgi:hypothetical protein
MKTITRSEIAAAKTAAPVVALINHYCGDIYTLTADTVADLKAAMDDVITTITPRRNDDELQVAIYDNGRLVAARTAINSHYTTDDHFIWYAKDWADLDNHGAIDADWWTGQTVRYTLRTALTVENERWCNGHGDYKQTNLTAKAFDDFGKEYTVQLVCHSELAAESVEAADVAALIDADCTVIKCANCRYSDRENTRVVA